MTKVSVIIPVYNAERTLQEAVESVLAQTFRDFELIFVIDGDCTDNSVEVALQFTGEATFVYTQHTTAAEGRNIGVECSRGEYVLFLDADDKIAPNYLEKTVAAMDLSLPYGVGIVSTDLQYFGERSDYVSQKLSTPRSNDMPITSLIRKTAFNEVKGFDSTMLWDDWDLWLRIFKFNWNVYFIHEPLFFYRIGINNLSGRVKAQGSLGEDQIRSRHG